MLAQCGYQSTELVVISPDNLLSVLSPVMYHGKQKVSSTVEEDNITIDIVLRFHLFKELTRGFMKDRYSNYRICIYHGSVY